MEWVSEHFDELWAKYAGEYIAVYGEKVVAHNLALAVIQGVTIAGGDGRLIQPSYYLIPAEGGEAIRMEGT